MVYNFLYNNWLLDLDYLFSDYLHFHDLRHFHSLLHYLLNDLGHLNNLLNNLLHPHDFLDYLVDVFYDINWNMHNLLHLLNLGILHNFLNNFLDREDSGHLNHPINYFLHKFRYFDYLVVDLEDLKNVIN